MRRLGAVARADDGMGIAADMLPRIFEMFTQVERNLKQSQSGLGIGLTLVRRLVEMHNGTVEATSEGRVAAASLSCIARGGGPRGDAEQRTNEGAKQHLRQGVAMRDSGRR